MPVVARSEEANIGLLDAKLRQEQYYSTFMARFMGFTKQSTKKGEPLPSNSPIAINRKPIESGMDFIIVPQLQNLTQGEFFGDDPIEGLLEDQSIYYNRVYVNQRRTGLKLPAKMSNQRIGSFHLASMAQPALQKKLPLLLENQMMMATYEGYSTNITAATSSEGLGIAKRYHPNMYGAGAGEVTWSGTQATHISNIHAVNSAVAGGATENQFNVNSLQLFDLYCDKKKIPHMVVKGGFEFRPLLISSHQAKQLQRDPEYRAAQQNANVRDMIQNPMFHGMFGFWEGWVLYKRLFSVKGLSSTSSTLTFGATGIDTLDNYDNKVAVTFGNSFLGGAVAQAVKYNTEEFDHKNRKEVSVSQIDGFALSSFYDDSTGTPTAVTNESSALLITNSPDLTV